MDLAFLGAYALGMFYAGHLADRSDLRWFLSAGMFYNQHRNTLEIWTSTAEGICSDAVERKRNTVTEGVCLLCVCVSAVCVCTGMLGSGVFICLQGMGYFWDIHNLSYYILVSVSTSHTHTHMRAHTHTHTARPCDSQAGLQHLTCSRVYTVCVCIFADHSRSVPVHRVAQCRGNRGQLVRQGQARPHHGHLERAHVSGQHCGYHHRNSCALMGE